MSSQNCRETKNYKGRTNQISCLLTLTKELDLNCCLFNFIFPVRYFFSYVTKALAHKGLVRFLTAFLHWQPVTHRAGGQWSWYRTRCWTTQAASHPQTASSWTTPLGMLPEIWTPDLFLRNPAPQLGQFPQIWNFI